jgi:multiple sugar transport system permease protein
MSAQTSVATDAPTRAARRKEAPARVKLPKQRVAHKSAILAFVLPFGILFALFYLVPIGYAIYQSLSSSSVRAHSVRPARSSAA